MSWTKRQLVEAAFEEIGYAAYTFDLQPEQLQSALRKLDSMLAQWNATGVRLGYPVPTEADGSDLDQDSNLPDAANEAVFLNLALRIASSVGKAPAMETKTNAKNAYDRLMAIAAQPGRMQFPDTLPAGAGSKSWRYEDDPFVRKPADPLLAAADAPIDFN